MYRQAAAKRCVFFSLCVCIRAGGHSMVPSPRGAPAVQLRHASGPVECRLHLCRDVQETVSPSCPASDGLTFVRFQFFEVLARFFPQCIFMPLLGTCCQMHSEPLVYRAAAVPSAVASDSRDSAFWEARVSVCGVTDEARHQPRCLP